MRNILIGCVLFFAVNASAATDIVATYASQDGSILTLVTRDSEHVRMDTSPTSYMLLKDDKIYSVYQDDSGQWMVMDMGQMMEAAASSGFMSLYGGGASQTQQTSYTATYTKTGRKEKIAGYTGIVYEAEMQENGQVVRRDEVVFCSHSDLRKVNEAWMAMAGKTGDVLGHDMMQTVEAAAENAGTSNYGGMLRYGDEMTLNSLKKMSLDLSYYAFPQNAQFMDMGQMQGFQNPEGTGSYQQSPETGNPYGGQDGQYQDQQYPDQQNQDMQGQYGQQETMEEEQTRPDQPKTLEEAAKESVRGLLDSIFK